MSDARSRVPRRGLRKALVALAFLLLAVVLAALSAPWWFDARRVSSLALDRAGTATGLAWRIDGEPELRWRPRPWLALPGLHVADASGRELLTAARVELALPWSTLRGETLRIEALRIEAPVIDADAALDWWHAQPASAAGPLPELEGVQIRDGRLTWSNGTIDRLQLLLPRFAIDEALALDLSARVRLHHPTADPTLVQQPAAEPSSFALTITATPRIEPLRLEALSLGVSGDGWVPDAHLQGRLQLSPWQVDAAGELAAWPAAWPALPPPIGEGSSPVTFSISQSGRGPLDSEGRLSLRRDANDLALRGTPAAVRAWIDTEGPDAPLLPPIEAEARLPSMDLDGVRLEGIHLRIDAGDDAAEPATDGDRPR